jgi:HK97 family phage prohead protease
MSEDYWKRSADAELVDVSYADRTITVVVMPYEVTADVMWNKRPVTEVISRGAFDGIQRRANRIRANRDHKDERTFGRASAFRPDQPEGLVADIHVARTPLGDETLTLAEDGCLDASAGFRPMPGGLSWETRDSYRITKAWLHHIALVPEGAYGENASVIEVRGAFAGITESAVPSATPNLDLARAWLLERAVGSSVL